MKRSRIDGAQQEAREGAPAVSTVVSRHCRLQAIEGEGSALSIVRLLRNLEALVNISELEAVGAVNPNQAVIQRAVVVPLVPILGAVPAGIVIVRERHGGGRLLVVWVVSVAFPDRRPIG